MSQESQLDSQIYTQGKKFMTQFFMMLKTAAIYDANNAAFTGNLELFASDLRALMERTGPLQIEVIEENLFINREKIKSDLYSYTAFSHLQKEWTGRKIGGFVFEGDPTNDELKHFLLALLQFHPDAEQNHETLNAALQAKGIEQIKALEYKERVLSSVDERTVSTNKASALRNYVRAVEIMKEAVGNFQEKKGFDPRKAKRVVYNLVKHSFDEGYSFVSLSTIKNYDLSTFHHCVNVCVIAISFGQNLGLSRRQLADLGIGALYHDIGKVNIPKEILNKTERFTDDEWRIMKLHPIMAIRHLLPLRGATDMDVKKVIPAFEHHRDYDLSGYPPLTIRKPLNFYSKVVAIADAYDAMTSQRVYQKGLTPSDAMQIIVKGAGKKFDPVLVKAFVNTMGIYPVGSVVQLNNGYIGVVSEVSKDPNMAERPKLVVVKSPQGMLAKPQNIDLSQPNLQKIVIQYAVGADEHQINVAHYLLSP